MTISDFVPMSGTVSLDVIAVSFNIQRKIASHIARAYPSRVQSRQILSDNRPASIYGEDLAIYVMKIDLTLVDTVGTGDGNNMSQECL